MHTATSPNTNSNSVSATREGRPVRRDFYQTIVIKNNGATVEDSEWKAVATGSTPREVRKQLKSAGMQSVRIFNAEGYKKARDDHRESLKTEAKSAREMIITEAFQALGIPVHPRLSSALRTLLPMFKDAPSNKTIAAFKNVIKTVQGAGDMTIKPASDTTVH